MINAILKKAVPIPKIMNYENYLFVGPHPDDIEMGCAPTIKKLVSMGKKVTFVIATNGCVGTTDRTLTREKLVKIRQEEALASAKTLGVTDVKFLDFDDGGLYKVEDMLVEICKVIIDLQPDVVFAPDDQVRSECHIDHIKVGTAVKYSLSGIPFHLFTTSIGREEICNSVKALALYYTDKPNVYVPISKFFDARMVALKCHKSQFELVDLDQVNMYLKLRATFFGLRHFKGKCDGYRVYGPTHMHCFPEASKW